MRTAAVPAFGLIAVGAQDLEILTQRSITEHAVELLSGVPTAFCGSVVVHVVNLKERQLGFVAAGAVTPVLR